MLAIALGTAAVVWVTCCYESVRQTITEWAVGYVGKAHVTVSSPLGKYDQIPQRVTKYLTEIDNVQQVVPRLVQRLRVEPWPRDMLDRDDIRPKRWTERTPEVDIHGIDPTCEFQIRTYPLKAGRMIREGDGLVCVLEADFAEDAGVGVGDTLLAWNESSETPIEVEIVGLFNRRRIARWQKPMALMRLGELQRICSKFSLITTADVVLNHADEASVKKALSKIRIAAQRATRSATIRSAESRMKQIQSAQSQQASVLVLLSCVAMLTALFIILSTLSMGMIERISRLGLIRCVGMTRGQLATMVILEVMPLGVIGVLVGIPTGLLCTWTTVVLVPEYVGTFTISWSGIALGTTAGLVTSLLAAILPAVAALGVSPLEAAHPRARRARNSLVFFVMLAAVALLAFQQFFILEWTHRSLYFIWYAVASLMLLYLAYALAAPFIVRVIGMPSVWVAAILLRVRPRLLQDQVGSAVWRSAGICCGLMVGLSLIIGVTVINESVTRGWQFPKEFPEAYVWSFDQFTPRTGELIADVPGIGDYTVGNSVNVIVEEMPIIGAELLHSVTWFMGCEPESFFRLVKLDFIEGDQATAIEKLKSGGHVIIADDFARSRNKHMGDKVKVFYGSRPPVEFTVAGVIRSPSIDIAANFFQLQSEYSVVASGSVTGTNEDLKRIFGVDGTKYVLLNFNLPPEAVPADWPPPKGRPGMQLADTFYDTRITLDRRWQRYREEHVLADVRRRIGKSNVFSGTVRELKDDIDKRLTEMTRLFTAIPTVALLVAAFGVANLMVVNVMARAKELAILRAVGATRGLVLRMVIGEALVLGLLGSGIGLLLGIHLAYIITDLVGRMWGFSIHVQMPWEMLGYAVALTIGLCILAGVLPARHAARTNVVDALHVA